MVIGDILIIADNEGSRRIPRKVICLDGLNMVGLRDEHGYGIRLYHRADYYPPFVLYFQSKQEQ